MIVYHFLYNDYSFHNYRFHIHIDYSLFLVPDQDQLLIPVIHYRLIIRLEQPGNQIRDQFYVMVGGGVVTGEWAEEIGADGYGRTAVDAVEVCNQLLAGTAQPGEATIKIGDV